MKMLRDLMQAPASTRETADQNPESRMTRLFGRRSIQVTLWAVLLLPVSAISQEQATDEYLQREWIETQTNKSHQVKSDWWQQLDLTRLNEYLRAGVDVNASDRRKWTPLHSAARYNTDPGILATLLQAGAVVGARNKAGDTPLHWAAAENANVEIVKSLIEAGANVNAKDKFGWTPLHTAAESGSNPEVIEVLLAAGAQRNKRAYFVLFRPVFLAKHNSNLSETDKKAAIALLKTSE